MSGSRLYDHRLWRLGMRLGTGLPVGVSYWTASRLGELYWFCCPGRRETTINNLLPVLNGDRRAAKWASRELFRQFGRKLVDLWRFEAGVPVEPQFREWLGWQHFSRAEARQRGVLLMTPHLGNWELGAPLLVRRGVKLYVVTLAEPDPKLTEIRRSFRGRAGIETIVIGDDPFAFVEIVRSLQAGHTVALLVDRPVTTASVTVRLFGRSFEASSAPAELARASGCALVPVCVLRKNDHYQVQAFPELDYDRAGLRDRAARQRLIQEIITSFEPMIRAHPDQWYHFVPVWPRRTVDAAGTVRTVRELSDTMKL